MATELSHNARNFVGCRTRCSKWHTQKHEIATEKPNQAVSQDPATLQQTRRCIQHRKGGAPRSKKQGPWLRRSACCADKRNGAMESAASRALAASPSQPESPFLCSVGNCITIPGARQTAPRSSSGSWRPISWCRRQTPVNAHEELLAATHGWETICRQLLNNTLHAKPAMRCMISNVLASVTLVC